ncbi:carbohydrate-binding module family 13 protein [Amanita muscaria]
MSSKVSFLAAGVLFLSQLASAQTPPFIGNLLLQPGLYAGACLTAASNSDGAAVTIQGCTGSPSQNWVFSGGQVHIFDNKCLDVTNGVNANGNKLQIWTCSNGNPDQQWYYDMWSNRLSWTNQGKCVDLTGGSLSDGNRIQIWDCTNNSPNQIWDTGYMANNLPYHSQDTQAGYNSCGTGSNQTSLCQTAWINSADDFCVWAPPNVGKIGDTEREEIAWCTKSGRGTRTIPDGTLKGVHFVKTPDYVQLSGVGDFTKVNIPAGDAGGELDNRGSDAKGNPVGGLVYGNSFGTALQYHEWTSFISDTQFCFRACVGASATSLCNHIYDEMGCDWNMPANYDPGVFENCDGDDDSPMGVYGTSTWHQGVSPTPTAHPAASSSNCKSLPTVSVGPANRRRELGKFEYKRAADPFFTSPPM